MSENDEVPQSITVIRDERGIAFLGEPASIKQWLDERGMTSREFKVKAAKVASSAIQATNKSAMIEARDDRLRKVQNRVGDLQSVFEQTADRVRGEKLLHPFTVDKMLSQLNDLTSQTYAFSKHLDIEIERKPIERAPEWGEVAGKFVGDVANGAAEGAQQLGGAIAEGAGALGDAAGKGAMDLGSAVADGAQELGKALGSIDLGKVAEAIPFKFPFGK